MKALLVIISMLAATYSYACSEPGCVDAPPGKPVAGGKFREPSSKKKHRRGGGKAGHHKGGKKHAAPAAEEPAAAAPAQPAAGGEASH